MSERLTDEEMLRFLRDMRNAILELDRLRDERDRLENRVASLKESYERARESEEETLRVWEETREDVEATGAHYEEKMGEMSNLDIFRSGVESIVDFWRQEGASYSQAAMEEVARQLDRFAARRREGERRGSSQ